MHQDNNNNNNFNDGDDDNKGFNRMDPNWASDGHEPYRSRSRSISPEPNSDPEEHRNINPDDFAMFSDFWQENPHLRDEAFREGWQQAMMATEDDLLKSNLIDTCSKCYLISFKYSKFSAKIRKLKISSVQKFILIPIFEPRWNEMFDMMHDGELEHQDIEDHFIMEVC